jgi:hypothetical protein
MSYHGFFLLILDYDGIKLLADAIEGKFYLLGK